MAKLKTEAQRKAFDLVCEQQKGLEECKPAWCVGEQLKIIIREEPDSAELLAKDLTVKEMSIEAAEKKVKEKADELHKSSKGNCVCVTPMQAEAVLRKFYGLKDRENLVPDDKVPEEGTDAPSGETGTDTINLEDFF